MMLYKGEEVEVIATGGSQSRIVKIGGEEWDSFWVPTEKLSTPSTPRCLKIAELTDEMQEFIEYLRTDASNTKLYFKVIAGERADMLCDQYLEITGEELVEGVGFSIQENNKQGAEGQVTFNPPANIPTAVQEYLAPGLTDKINIISFVWLLVEQGFRVTR